MGPTEPTCRASSKAIRQFSFQGSDSRAAIQSQTKTTSTNVAFIRDATLAQPDRLYLRFSGTDRGHGRFFLQRARSQPEEAIRPRPVAARLPTLGSKSIDDVSSFNITGSASQPVAGENDLAQNPYDLAAERGRSMFDSRHRFVLSYQWNIPFWNHPANWYQQAFGNWQLNGIFTAMTGGPFTVFDSSDNSLQGGAPEITGFSANRPNVVGNPNSGPRTPQEWFNVSAFQQLAPDPLGRFQVFGNEGRNVIAGPGYVNWDFSVFKNIKVTESKDIQFRGELFNLLNHTNFRLPVSDISSPNFGQIQTDVSPRVIQVALKFLF